MIKSFTKAAVCVAAFAAVNAHAITVIGTANYNGHTYSLLSQANWEDSETFAVSQGGHLAAVNDAAENTFLNATWGTTRTLWIGLKRTAPNAPTFAWSNGDAVAYTNWSGGEPNNYWNGLVGEDYTHTYTNGTWNDLANNSGYAYPQYGVMEVSAVPESETLAMLLAGLGLVGAVARRRKQA